MRNEISIVPLSSLKILFVAMWAELSQKKHPKSSKILQQMEQKT
jgi:hypothetical protein